MFGRRDENTTETTDQSPATQRSESTTRAPALPRAATPATTMGRDIAASRRVGTAGHMSQQPKTLTVGPGLSLSGEITSCDVLIVEGKVEAKLTDGKMLEITESGQFRGSVEIENADIAGRYDGQLVVHGRLTVRSTGRISGMVKYGELEVNAGGQIIGELQVVGGGAQTAQGGTNFKSAAKFTALLEEDEAASSSPSDRKSA